MRVRLLRAPRRVLGATMKLRALRLLSTDGKRILFLAFIVLLLAFGGIELSRVVSANMLRADAQSTVGAWAGSLVESADDIGALVAGATPSARTDHLLKDATEVGDIYRYTIWDRNGHAVFSSEREGYSSATKTTTNADWGKIAGTVLSG